MTDLIAAFDEAVHRGGASVTEALAACDARLVDGPDDVEALVCRGALLVLSGRDAFLPWTRARLVREGLALMDKTVDSARAAGGPPGLRLLVIRALSHARLPRLLRSPRRVRALAEEILSHTSYAELPDIIRMEIVAHLREALYRTGENTSAPFETKADATPA